MEKAYKLEFAEEESGSLYVTCCGLSQTLPHHSFGPAIKPHYMIHFIISGKGHFSIGGKKYPLEAGYGFLITPEELAYYEADAKDPWTYVWVGFGGNLAPQTITLLGLSLQQPVFRCDDSDRIYEIVHNMMEHNTFSIADVLERNGQLSLFLSVVASSSIPEKNDSAGANNYVQKAVSFIRANYYNPIKITDVAAYVCINRSYLYTLFQKATGMSPQQYLTSFRIAKAVELLQLTELPIESIAISCGYSDPMVFSKAFRLEKKLSPSAYRKELQKGETRRNKDHLKQVEEFIEEKRTAIPGQTRLSPISDLQNPELS